MKQKTGDNQPETQKDREKARSLNREVGGSLFSEITSVQESADLLLDRRVPLSNRQNLAQEIGRLHGNRHLQRLLDGQAERGGAKEAPDVQRDLVDYLGGIAEEAIDTIFRQVVSSNRDSSSTITIPDDWPTIVREYAEASGEDFHVLTHALGRSPTFHRGGWIMDIQPDAAAMTLDRDVFVSGQLNLKTYAHELVHVSQYADLGPTAFLVSYFGLSAYTIARRLINREPLNIMRSSPHEEEAYQLGQRFADWYMGRYRKDARTIRA